MVDGKKIERVDECVYLVQLIIFDKDGEDKEVQRHIRLSYGVFGKLSQSFKCKKVPLSLILTRWCSADYGLRCGNLDPHTVMNPKAASSPKKVGARHVGRHS